MPRMRQASARPAMQQVVARAGVVEHQAAEDRGVADAVEGRVEVGAPLARRGPTSRAMIPSTLSEKTNAVMTRHADQSWPRGKNASAPTHTPTVPTTVTTSGLMPSRRNSWAIGRQDLGQRRAQESVEHGGASVLTGRPPGHRTTWRVRRHAVGVSAAARPRRAACRVSSSSTGSALVWATIGRKFESPPQRGTTCWCRWAATPAPATAPWFMPRLKPVRLRRRLQRADRLLGQRGELGRLLVGEVDVERRRGGRGRRARAPGCTGRGSSRRSSARRGGR